ncbi:hypothetical protein B0A48_15116 [Cryoendolithus antarcticus]|uniref:Heme haloperoxidase family profile domain-containing protein n=1 Tax=Cryoendolithus antarcticus TaxID=1507870 RepID=A0A1V8SJR0_9PEZI|nr:hypothetical protein B0A48_15116 [Cryoendolithus antarcticus]
MVALVATTALVAFSLPLTLAYPSPQPLLGLPTGPAPITDPRFTTWNAPGSGDVRSPCPGLNALANHGFIHHNGKNLTIPHLVDGLAAGLNMGVDFTVLIGGAGLLASPNPLGGSFDLNQLDQHNFPIEHDASLSREDAYFGNDYSFNQKIWNMVLTVYKGKTTTDIPTAAKVLSARTQDEQKRDPQFTYGLREFIFRYGETALYLQTMSDPVSGVARLDFIRELFEKERLPVDLGWRPSTLPITLASLGVMVNNLFAANPQNGPEGVTIASNSYKDLIEGFIGGSEVLGNLTGGLSKQTGL